MRYHRSKGGTLRHLDRLQRLSQGADLIELNENRISCLFLDTAFKPLCIRHEQVVANQLYAIAQALPQELPTLPVVLAQAILDGDDRILGDPLCVEVDHLARSERTALSSQHVFTIIVKLRGRRVHTQENIHARFIARRIYGRHDNLQCFAVRTERWCETSLISNISIQLFPVQHLFQALVHFGSHAQRVTK